MTKKQYNAWLDKLAQTDDPDILDIVATARQAAWRIDTYWPVEAKNVVMHQFECEDESGWNRLIKEGWVSIHGKYIVTWYDGI